MNYPQASTVSGFLHLVGTVGAQKLLDGWKGKKEYNRVYDHAKFFANQGIDTFEHLVTWLKDEGNRDKLTTEGLGIRDRTADYYRVLVRLPEAVKVDSRVEEFLTDADINIKSYEYKELRTIVQLAAKQLGKRPIDLEGAIWNYKESNKGGKMNGKKTGHRIQKASHITASWMKQAKAFCQNQGLSKECHIIEDMDFPQNWDRPKFKNAVKGNFERLWKLKNINGPPGWNHQPRFSKAFDEYIVPREGKAWYARNKPVWASISMAAPSAVGTFSASPSLSPVPVTITMHLLPNRKVRLDELAKEYGISVDDLCKVWILDQLRKC